MTIQNIRRLAIIFVTLSILAIFAVAPAVFAHGDEEHEETEKSEMSTEQMEQMVKILQQLVTLLTQYKAQYGSYYTPAPAYVAPVIHAEEAEHHEEATEEHHEEAAVTPAPAVVTQLVVELEEHSGKTHAHVRYVDKTEEMFFVDVPLSNEAGVISAISAKTGLSADDIKKAIKYTGM